jgi:hypothetical protein
VAGRPGGSVIKTGKLEERRLIAVSYLLKTALIRENYE